MLIATLSQAGNVRLFKLLVMTNAGLFVRTESSLALRNVMMEAFQQKEMAMDAPLTAKLSLASLAQAHLPSASQSAVTNLSSKESSAMTETLSTAMDARTAALKKLASTVSKMPLSVIPDAPTYVETRLLSRESSVMMVTVSQTTVAQTNAKLNQAGTAGMIKLLARLSVHLSVEIN